ncbi:MAG: DNA double-strand break repair nuclease NurA [Nitrososphaerales archaeon]
MIKEELSDWSKLPRRLQDEYFHIAKEEAEKCKQILKMRSKKISEIKKFLRFQAIEEDFDWRSLKVGVVDGSNSKVLSERVGIRYGVYAACYQIYEGDKLIDEDFFGDYLVQNQIDESELATRILSLKRVLLERMVALKCLEEKDLDYFIIDGSFFGYRGDIPLSLNEIVEVNREPLIVKDLIREITNFTLKLLDSKRVIGIIKRSRLSAIDGWLAHKFKGEDRCMGTSDKYILSLTMPPKTLFSYESLLGNPYSYLHFDKFRKLFRKLFKRSNERDGIDMAIILEKAEDEIDVIIKALGCSREDFFSTKRYYVRCTPNANPFEVEAHKDMDIKPMLAYFLNFYNEATGLPFPLDLVDESITLPSGFLREFVEEIEAQLIKDEEVSKEHIFLTFTQINPQKQED